MLRKGISGRKIATFVQVAIASFVLAAFALYYFRISPLAILRQNNDGLDLGSMTVPADGAFSPFSLLATMSFRPQLILTF